MEGELYRALYLVVHSLGQQFRTPHVMHADWQIVLTYLWAVLHERPVSWACQDENWPVQAGLRRRPSPATMSRRLRRENVQSFLVELEKRWRQRLVGKPSKGTPVRVVDGKILPVGGLSGDPDASVGYGAGKIARGYKLHILCDEDGLLLDWHVDTLRQGEVASAEILVTRQGRGNGYLVADGNYDKNRLYDHAGAQGWQLVTRQRPGRGLGHRRHSPFRIRSRQIRPRLRRSLLRKRGVIERTFGMLCSGSVGLAPLPSWVRTLPRVRLWIRAKIILFFVKIYLRQKAA